MYHQTTHVHNSRTREFTGAGFALRMTGKDTRAGAWFKVNETLAVPVWLEALLHSALPEAVSCDSFVMPMPAMKQNSSSAEEVLACVLEGFVENPPKNVGYLQRLRNFIVAPLGLRVSPLGCPVSSLLSSATSNTSSFSGFPVHDVLMHGDRNQVAVVLGADDKHLRFRTVVAVDLDEETIHMATTVLPLNWFGTFYWSLIDYTHRKFVTPELMRWSAAFATAKLQATQKKYSGVNKND
jgi:hypothetical protein